MKHRRATSPRRSITLAVSAIAALVLVAAPAYSAPVRALGHPTTVESGAHTHFAMRPSARAPLSWQPPALRRPIILRIPNTGGWFHLDSRRDYIVRVGDVSGLGGVTLEGGHDIRMIGGHITIPDAPAVMSEQGRALYFKDQTGIVHVEGLLIDDEGGGLEEGINMDAPRAIFQIENVRITGIHARDEEQFSDTHPDLIQPWGGVRALRVDGLTGSSDYQGIFLGHSVESQIPIADLRRINITGTPTSKNLFWQIPGVHVKLQGVYITPGKHRELGWSVMPNVYSPAEQVALVAADGSLSWASGAGIEGRIELGTPPSGSFVPRGIAGTGYESPGYAAPVTR